MASLGPRALILADGELVDRAAIDAAWPGWAAGLELVVAADGGMRLAEPLEVAIDAWVGDADSTSPAELERLARTGIEIRRVAAAKDESDAELALAFALERGAVDITIVGALGGPRFDHALANVGLLGHPGLAGRPARILGPAARLSLIEAPAADGAAVRRSLGGRPGDVVSLMPIGDVAGVTTRGLEFPLRDEPLPFGPARGLSNVRRSARAAVAVRHGRLLIVEVPLAILGR